MVKRTHLPGLIILLLGLSLLSCGTEGGPSGGAENLPSAAIVPFTKSAGSPLLAQSGHDYRRPWLLKHEGEFRLWISDLDVGSGIPPQILSLSSNNGLDWNAEESTPFPAQAEGWEAGRIESPCVLFHQGSFWLWYIGGNGAGIGLATSDDGLQWQRHPDNPVMTPDTNWEMATEGPSFLSPSVVVVDKLFSIWILAGNGQGLIRAYSEDGVSWTREKQGSLFGPAPASTTTSVWDQNRLTSATVTAEITSAGRLHYRMWYSGTRLNIGGQEVGGLGFAGSFDGLDWTRSTANPILQDGGLNEGEAFPFRMEEQDVLFFTEFWKKEGNNRHVLRLAEHGLTALLVEE